MFQAVLIGSSYVFFSLILPLLLLSLILNKRVDSIIDSTFATIIEVITFIAEKTIELYCFFNSSLSRCISGVNRDKIIDNNSVNSCKSDSNRSDDHSENGHVIDEFYVCDKYFHCNDKGIYTYIHTYTRI
jgi:hypothetical protein